MKYIILILLMLPALYLISYAQYSWKDSKFSAMGLIIILVMSIVLPAYMLFIK
jgi:hypothetical protein